MASDDSMMAGESDWPVTNPWPALVLGLGAVVVACGLRVILSPGEWPILRVVLLVLGLIAAGAAVSIRPYSPVVVAGAALAGFLACQDYVLPISGIDPEWDSFRLLVKVLSGVAAVAAILLVLPGPVSRVLVGLLIVLHFGGIYSAATSVAPPRYQPPWLPQEIWTRLYRPYVQFAYLNNAYHFYSPEPGPATLLWFCIEYEDHSTRWVKLPNRAEHHTDPLGNEYYRRLSLTESVNQTSAVPAVPNDIQTRRYLAGEQFKAGPIPLHPYWPVNDQYSPPIPICRILMSSYVRHVARSYPNQTDPSLRVLGVKLYRIRHWMLGPRDVATDTGGEYGKSNPKRKDLFHTYYQGEYDTDGNLKDPNDPFLYWWIPIIPIYENQQTIKRGARVYLVPPDPNSKIVEFRDCFSMHAGSDPWGGDQ